MTRSHPQTRINLTYAQVTGDTLPGSDGGDLAGNMTTIPRVSAPGTAQTTVYDAWNRLVELRQGGTVIADYKYDGRGRRIFKSTTDESRDFYYSNAWQILEERVSGAADTQYVWGLRYVDELICRDYDNDSDGTLEQRMYALQDANFNLTCIVDTSGDPQERYIYSPYGVRSIFNAFFTSRSYSSYVWMIAHQGLMLDIESGLVYNRNRMLHPKLGRFLQRDPLGYIDGASLYGYLQDNAPSLEDPLGTVTNWPGGPHQPGGPWEPDGEYSCKGTDTCAELQEKIGAIQKAIESHCDWDVDHPNPDPIRWPNGRHYKDTLGFFGALRRCYRIYEKNGCRKTKPRDPKPIPVPVPVPVPVPAPVQPRGHWVGQSCHMQWVSDEPPVCVQPPPKEVIMAMIVVAGAIVIVVTCPECVIAAPIFAP